MEGLLRMPSCVLVFCWLPGPSHSHASPGQGRTVPTQEPKCDHRERGSERVGQKGGMWGIKVPPGSDHRGAGPPSAPCHVTGLSQARALHHIHRSLGGEPGGGPDDPGELLVQGQGISPPQCCPILCVPPLFLAEGAAGVGLATCPWGL